MAPAKRKADDDDFVYTLPDIDGEIPDEEAPAPPPKKKTKTKKQKGSQKNKKAAPKTAPLGHDDDNSDDDAANGIWGNIVDDDGAMDSDFEFVTDGGVLEDNFDGWGFDSAKDKEEASGGKRGVDIEDIIRRRREKRGEKEDEDQEEENDNEDDQEDDEVEDGMDIDLEDGEDGLLADDAFGMNVDIGEDESDEENEDDDDDSSVLSAVPHPDDEIESDSDASDETDAEEEAKRKAFFAPEEEINPPASKNDKKSALSFQAMGLSRPIARGLGALGFSRPTPIQAKTIPIALLGKDIVGGAVTGSGKTAAFLVPILERLMFRPKKLAVSRVVVLAPTRELAIQCHAVATKLAAYTDIKFSLAVGGLSLKTQEAELRQRPDVIIATPGRFIDHMRNSASFAVDTVEILVLDEADRMLEDGFADELNEILTTLPKSRQTMLFSATMTSSVDNLIRVGLNKPARIMVDSQQKTAGNLTQEFVRLREGREGKRMGYLIYLCKTLYQERVIIFFRQKLEAHRARVIFALLGLSCAELHGSMTQQQRIESVEAFRDGKVCYLLATDLASRGLDIRGVDTVINYEAPQKLEIYIHRIGRTARAGRAGVACTLAAEADRKVVKAAVKAGRATGARISSRVVEATVADEWQAKVDGLADEIEAVMRDEKEERQLAHVEMQVKKGENLLEHEAEIKARPKRTWFETQEQKKKAKEAGRAELNGGERAVSALRDKLKHKGHGTLSNKDRKKLDLKAERAGGGSGWRKGAAERVGKGVVADMRRGKVTKAKAKVRSEKKEAAPEKAKDKGGKQRGGKQKRAAK